MTSEFQEYFKDIPTVSLASVTVSVVSVTNKSTHEHFGCLTVSRMSHISLEYKLPDRLWRRSEQREALTRMGIIKKVRSSRNTSKRNGHSRC
jgi:hypothetical protein